jgi:hypothetical protein
VEPQLRLPKGDIALAIKVAIDSLCARSAEEHSTWSPYHWLLDREPLDESPMWWSAEDRARLLRGSHLVEACAKAGEDFEHDWNVVKDVLHELVVANHPADAPQVSASHDVLRETFRRAVAAIHSRSFNACAEDTTTAVEESLHTVLVPVLDCANHFRKPRECSWRVQKVDRPRAGDWSVVVEALKDFNPRDPIRIAYVGALHHRL